MDEKIYLSLTKFKNTNKIEYCEGLAKGNSHVEAVQSIVNFYGDELINIEMCYELEAIIEFQSEFNWEKEVIGF